MPSGQRAALELVRSFPTLLVMGSLLSAFPVPAQRNSARPSSVRMFIAYGRPWPATGLGPRAQCTEVSVRVVTPAAKLSPA